MDDDSYRFYASVHTLYILLGRSFDANVSHHGIGVSRGQYMILYLLSKNGQMPQRRIAELCNLQKPTVSQHLKALCESGYALQYHIPGNQRCKMVAVTQRGRAELERMNALLKQDFEKRFSKDELHRINTRFRACAPILHQLRVKKKTRRRDDDKKVGPINSGI